MRRLPSYTLPAAGLFLNMALCPPANSTAGGVPMRKLPSCALHHAPRLQKGLRPGEADCCDSWLPKQLRWQPC